MFKLYEKFKAYFLTYFAAVWKGFNQFKSHANLNTNNVIGGHRAVCYCCMTSGNSALLSANYWLHIGWLCDRVYTLRKSLMRIFTFFLILQHGNTALHEAAWKGFSQTVQILCKWKANAYIKNRGGFAPLHLCCQNGHNETCRVLLLAGCKPDIKNNVCNYQTW